MEERQNTKLKHCVYMCIFHDVVTIDLRYQSFGSVSSDRAYQSLTEAALTAHQQCLSEPSVRPGETHC